MFEAMEFRGVWRDYQQRVLDEFELHLADDRINVVAAPGSGKTVLGLELVRRLGRPAILLSPSLTIRNQWAERLTPLFLEGPPPAELVTHDLARPAPLTCGTYQSLHAIWAETGQPRFADLLEWARAAGPITVVLDEAHHLRREWWRALDALLEELEGTRIVSLTATPPYDAPLIEWRRFETVCGSIDLEIGIPELVRNGDLCPHQDHIVFSRPSEDLLSLLDQRRAAIAHIVDDLRADATLADAIEQHPWLRDPSEHLAPILDDPTILSSMLVHLHAIGRRLPRDAVKLLGVDPANTPPQTERWTEALLNALLYDLGETSPIEKEARKALQNRLHKRGLIEGDRVRLGETRRIVRMMAGDRAKIGSICRIARAEADSRGGDLRMVVLTDHIRASELPRSAGEFQPAKLGVAPIFETLRRETLPAQRLGVLTGTLVILPRDAFEALKRLAGNRAIDEGDLRAVTLPHCDSHVSIRASGAGKRHLVSMVTELFETGQITILVGTHSLLGEGWDAPAIDSLILASNTASYMLSNQMRGRAIRVDAARPGKVANIWHLATVADMDAVNQVERLNDHFDWGAVAAGQGLSTDLDLLSRRFEAFAGISNDGSQRIRTGLDRLGIAAHPSLDAANAASFARAADREAIARDWAASLGDAPERAHVREVAAPRHFPRRLVWRSTLQSLALSGLASGAAAAGWSLLADFGAQPWTVLLAGAGSAAAIATFPKAARSLRFLWRNGSLENSLREVGQMILWGLHHAGIMTDAELDDAAVIVEGSIDGTRTIAFDGLGRSADIAAMDALVELLGPIQNPRYLLIRRGGLASNGKDYLAIPALFSPNRKAADAFAKKWSTRIGPSRAVWTRSEEGRQALLLARRESLSAGMQRKVDRRSEWR